MAKKPNYWTCIFTRPTLPKGDNWPTNINEMWQYNAPSKIKFVVEVYYLPNTKWGEMRHIVIKKVDFRDVAKSGISGFYNSKYPTYNDRVLVLKACGKWKRFALEVFPSISNLIDNANLYHLWEFKREDILPFSTAEIFEAPDVFEHKLDLKDCTIEYCEKTGFIDRSPFKYLYLRRTDGKDFTWYQKQIAKEEIYSNDITAIELILDRPVHNNYVCLICLPYNFRLGFGLNGEK